MNWFGSLFKKLGGLFPSCKEAARLQSEALDRSLPFGRRLGLRVHLMICKWCRRYGRQIAFLRAAAHSHAGEFEASSSNGLSPEAKQRIASKLEAGGKSM